MHVKQKLMYMGFGCLLTLAGYILSSLANDSVAQSGEQDVTFGKITCSELRVVDEEGHAGVLLRTNEYGGVVYASGKDGGAAQLTTNKFGGVVYASGKDGGSVQLSNTANGGAVYASGKDGGAVRLSITEHGGAVVASGKDGKGGAQLGLYDKYGGGMSLFNKGGENVLQASVADDGGGLVATRDKHGYRTGRLP